MGSLIQALLTLLGSEPLHSESWRDSSLSQLGPHNTNCAPPSCSSLAHSKTQERVIEQEREGARRGDLMEFGEISSIQENFNIIA